MCFYDGPCSVCCTDIMWMPQVCVKIYMRVRQVLMHSKTWNMHQPVYMCSDIFRFYTTVCFQFSRSAVLVLCESFTLFTPLYLGPHCSKTSYRDLLNNKWYNNQCNYCLWWTHIYFTFLWHVCHWPISEWCTHRYRCQIDWSYIFKCLS